MSYLERLKAKTAPNPFEGFEGAVREHVSRTSTPFEGFEGDEGIDVRRNQPPPGAAPASSFLERLQTKSESEVFRQKKPPAGADAVPQTYLPQAPSKPSKALVDFHEPQVDPSRCHTCGEREELHRPFVAVLTTKADERHWLHQGDCHVEHSRRCAERREAVGLDRT